MLKGKLFKKNNQIWTVKYDNPNFTTVPIPICELPIYTKDLTESQIISLIEDMEVNFEIMDEFTHSHLYDDVGLFDGIIVAKLNFN
jgi:hypothetical protein